LTLSQAEVANSNIAALVATLLVRLVSGTLCDKFGPRYVFAGCLLAGAIPTALAGTVSSAAGLITLRFFVGILGASFVPCQVWSTGFFDKVCGPDWGQWLLLLTSAQNVVGTANALTGGFGNAGGGITYFVMPAIFDSLVRDRGLTPRVAWRVSFIVPFILITSTAIAMLLLCPDTPTGKWSERLLHVQQRIDAEHQAGHKVTRNGSISATPAAHSTHATDSKTDDFKSKELSGHTSSNDELETQVGDTQVVDQYTHETIRAPTFKDTLKIFASPQSIALAACYFCSFGSELAINSILGSYYAVNFPSLGQTRSGQWAAMFGLLNVIFRPLGGVVGDLVYKYTNGSLWAKKIWIHFLAISCGVFLIAIGATNPHHLPTMIGLVAGAALFMDAGNGANFALVPHVHPHANGKFIRTPNFSNLSHGSRSSSQYSGD